VVQVHLSLFGHEFMERSSGPRFERAMTINVEASILRSSLHVFLLLKFLQDLPRSFA
jgi:hypothetical protein